jgi:hypothetical protein
LQLGNPDIPLMTALAGRSYHGAMLAILGDRRVSGPAIHL